MSQCICPICGARHNPTPRRSAARMLKHPGLHASNAEVRAYYHATAPAEDIAFVLRVAPDLMMPDGSTIMTDHPTAAYACRVFSAFRIARNTFYTPATPESERRFWQAHTTRPCDHPTPIT